jgi:hypothetical protein
MAWASRWCGCSEPRGGSKKTCSKCGGDLRPTKKTANPLSDPLVDKPSRVGERVESVAGMRGEIVSVSKALDFHVTVRWENGHVGSISRANLKTREAK